MSDQLDMFQVLMDDFKIRKKIRLIELFAGVGSQSMAFRDLGKLKGFKSVTMDFEHHKVIEFDKYAIKSYNVIHNSNFETYDVMQVRSEDLEITDQETYCYFMTYSFPCQDLSKAGKQKGMSKDSGTRSGLLWEVERILGECFKDECLPQVLLMENVPEVIGSKNYADFMKWYASLEAIGYQSYYKILNAKDFGIPQNRRRCFMVSILGDYNYTFPKEKPLKLMLKDMLEQNVDEKYYLSDKQVAYFEKHSKECEEKGNGFRFKPSEGEGVARTCTAHPSGLRMDDNFIKVKGSVAIGNNESNNRVYGTDGLSPTLNTMQGGHRQPKIVCNVNPSQKEINGNVYDGDLAPTLTTNKGEGIKIIEPIEGGASVVIPEATKLGYALANDGDGVYINRPHQKRGVVQKGMIQTLKTSCADVGVVVSSDGIYTNDSEAFHSGPIENISRTLKAEKHDAGVREVEILKSNKTRTRIRKLTPLECWRLMGFTDDDFHKAESVNSNSQLYKQAGNSIVKHVLMEIINQMIPDDYEYFIKEEKQ